MPVKNTTSRRYTVSFPADRSMVSLAGVWDTLKEFLSRIVFYQHYFDICLSSSGRSPSVLNPANGRRLDGKLDDHSLAVRYLPHLDE